MMRSERDKPVSNNGTCTAHRKAFLVGIQISRNSIGSMAKYARHDRREYLALLASLILIFLEGLIRVITLGLRKSCSLDTSILLKFV